MRDYLGNLRADYVGWNHCPAAGLDYIDRTVLHPDHRVAIQNIRLPDMNKRRFFFGWIERELQIINAKLDLLIKEQDFSKEEKRPERQV